MKKIFFTMFFIFFVSLNAFAEELNLECGKVYLLNFDSEIQNFHADSAVLDAQILHSIFNDKKQIILSLKSDKGADLQVKTEDYYKKYNIKNSSKVSRELIEIDIPPFENLDVDVYDGGK